MPRRHIPGRPPGANSRQLKRLLWQAAYGDRTLIPCHWCRVKLTFDDATVDHEPPVSRGGSWYRAVLACGPCNAERGRDNAAKHLEELLKAKRKRKKKCKGTRPKKKKKR